MVLEATKGSYPSGALGARTVARPPGRSNRPATRRVRRRQCIVRLPASTAAPTNGCTVTTDQLRKCTRSNGGATRCAVSKLAEAIQPALRVGGTATAPHGRKPAPTIAQGPPTSAPAVAWRRAKLDADEVDEALHCRQRRGQLDVNGRGGRSPRRRLPAGRPRRCGRTSSTTTCRHTSARSRPAAFAVRGGPRGRGAGSGRSTTTATAARRRERTAPAGLALAEGVRVPPDVRRCRRGSRVTLCTGQPRRP